MPVAKKTVKKQREPVTSKKYTNMFQAYGAFWRRGFTEWAGTSSRSEYWWSVLVNFLVIIGWVFLVAVAGWQGGFYAPVHFVYTPGVMVLFALMVVFSVAVIIPALSMTVRRLHDAGLSAWWMMLLIGTAVEGLDVIISIVFFVFSVLPTKETDNPYHGFNKVTK